MRPPSVLDRKSSASPAELPVPPAHLIRRGRSGIHGRGVYARVAIPEGHKIVEYVGERITKAESERREAVRYERIRRGLDGATYIFELNSRYDLDGRRGGNLSRFFNHSCDPNCRAEQDRGRIWIIARRDIMPGEELTYDYGFSISDWADNPCRCGAAGCAGFIVAQGQRWRVRRMRTAR
jgi:SET domain-containing protein